MPEERNYKPTTQDPYCCVPACLAMILNRREIKHGTQEKIGHALGLVVPEGDEKLFNEVRTSEEEPSGGYGTQIIKEEFSINGYFSENDIDLEEIYFPPGEIDDFADFIEKKLEEGSDIIACYHYGDLFEGGLKGHASLVENVEGNRVILIDPGFNKPVRREVNISNLKKSMEYHGEENRGGFWVISE